jgi:hypothetical protein
LIVFKHKVQDELRAKYKDAMESMEREVDSMRLESLASAAMGLGFLNINYAEIDQ